MHLDFLKYSTGKLNQYESRIETCLDKLTCEQIWARGAENQNAVGNLVLHLCGNLGQWILSGVGGAPDHRDRDAEFAARGDVGAGELKLRIRSRSLLSSKDRSPRTYSRSKARDQHRRLCILINGRDVYNRALALL